MKTRDITSKNNNAPKASLVFPSKESAPHEDGRKKAFYIVGMGGSAGSLEAFEQFLQNMPVDTGLAFVLVSHLDPTHKGILPELLQRVTTMEVLQVKDGTKVQPNSVYVIPPNKDMSILHATLQLLEPSKPRGLRMPIDFFFRHLAEDQGANSIGIIFSGMGTDGTLGFKAIKEKLGMTMVQDVSSAKYQDLEKMNADTAYRNLSGQNPLAIMVAEDNPSNKEVIVEMLRKMGYRPDAVADGHEVLQNLKIRSYDLILMDIKMSEMDGITATREIRRLWPATELPYIVAITAFAMEGDREKYLEAGMNDYIAKPVQKRDLEDVLMKYSGGRAGRPGRRVNQNHTRRAPPIPRSSAQSPFRPKDLAQEFPLLAFAQVPLQSLAHRRRTFPLAGRLQNALKQPVININGQSHLLVLPLDDIMDHRRCCVNPLLRRNTGTRCKTRRARASDSPSVGMWVLGARTRARTV